MPSILPRATSHKACLLPSETCWLRQQLALHFFVTRFAFPVILFQLVKSEISILFLLLTVNVLSMTTLSSHKELTFQPPQLLELYTHLSFQMLKKERDYSQVATCCNSSIQLAFHHQMLSVYFPLYFIFFSF